MCIIGRQGGAAELRHSWTDRLFLATALTTSLGSIAVAAEPPSANIIAGPSPATASAPGDGIGEIVVTAERREGNPQKIPTSIQAVSATALQAANVNSALDLSKMVPSALLQQNNGSVTSFLRGVGNDIVTVGNEPSNAVYIDGVYYSRLTSSTLRLNNIDRVEVLEGPQGTLFGRNATGGLFQIVTKNPKLDASPTVDASATYGSYNTTDDSIYLSSGLGSNAAADIAVDYYNNPGFGHNVDDGSRANYEQSFSLRSKVLYEIEPSTTIVLSAHYEHSDSDIGTLGQYPGTPKANFGNTALPLTGGLLPGIGFYDTDQDSPSYFKSESYGLSLKLDHDLGFAQLVDIFAYNSDREVLASDADYTPQPFKAAVLPSFTRTITNEFQLLSKKDSWAAWAVGLYYLHTDQGYNGGILSGPGFGVPAPTSLRFDSLLPSQSYALYGQTTVPLYGKLKLTLGGRLSEDDTEGQGNIDLLLSPSGPAVGIVPTTRADHTNRQFSWKTGLSYQLTDSLLAYTSISRGYKAGLYNLLTFDPDYINPEELTAYEAGAKTDLLDGRLRLNGDVFYYQIHNSQAEVAANGLPALMNARGSEMRGAELRGDAVLPVGFHLRFGVALLDGRYTSYSNAPFYTPGTAPTFGLAGPVSESAAGDRLVQAPEFSGNIGTSYALVLSSGDKVSGNLNYAYISEFNWTADNRLKQPGYGLLDASLSYGIHNTGVTVKVWGSNLTASHYATEGYESGGAQGDVGAAGAPRQVGVTLMYSYK